MKTTSMVALIAAISAVSIGAISMNGFTVPLATASVSPESGAIMGHVEYILRDSDGNIKSYIQGDNVVVNKGDDCVISYAFQKAITSDNCTISANGFRFIGIGNGTITPDNGDTTLLDSGATTVAGGSPGAEGIMAVRVDSDTIGAASTGTGGTVAIATETPFTFVAANATTVTAAGLFDATCSGVSTTTGACTANASTMNMFSVQSISVAVSSGDSLSVTWTITVGNSS